jgi:hypothetical protein
MKLNTDVIPPQTTLVSTFPIDIYQQQSYDTHRVMWYDHQCY